MTCAKRFSRAAFFALAASAAVLVSCHDVTLSRNTSGLSVRMDLRGVLQELYGGGYDRSAGGEGISVTASLKDTGGNAISSVGKDVVGTEVTLEFGGVPVGTGAVVEVLLYNDDGSVVGAGGSGPFTVRSGVNQVPVDMARVYASWAALKSAVEDAGENGGTFVIYGAGGDWTATESIEINENSSVTIRPYNGCTIIRGSGFSWAFFETAGPLAVRGTTAATITLDGGYNNGAGITAAAPLISAYGDLTLEHCTLRNNFNNGVVDESGNRDNTADNGGAIYIENGTLVIGEGALVTGNKAGDNGGGIYTGNDVSVRMNAGKISGNEATGTGGGIYHNNTDDGIKQEITGGEVTGNKADNGAGGIYIYGGMPVCISGSVTVKNNTVDEEPSNLVMSDEWSPLTVAGSLSGSSIGVALESGTGTFTSGYGAHNKADPSDVFTSDAGYTVVKSGDEAALTESGGDGGDSTTITSWSDLKSAIEAAESGGTFVIGGDLTATNTISVIYYPVEITSNGAYTIGRGDGFTDAFFETAESFSITGAEGAIITLDGGSDESTAAPFIIAGADLKLEHCALQNNINSSSDGGAIFVDTTATVSVTVTSCTFENNSVTGSSAAGGAVAINDASSTSTFDSCVFTNNSAVNQGGGAVYILGAASDMSEFWHTFKGCSFTGNYSNYTSNHGGAIYISRGPVAIDTITMENNYVGTDATTGTSSDVYIAGYQQELKLSGAVKIPALKLQVTTGTSATPKDMGVSDSFAASSEIGEILLTPSSGTVSDGLQVFKVYSYDSVGTNSQVDAVLTEEQLNCFTSITDSDGNSYTLNTDGTITAN